MKRNNKTIDNRVLLYQVRSASECMNAAFDFIRQNWKVLLRYSLYVLLPVCVLQTVGLISIVDSALSQIGEFPMTDFVTIFVLGTVGFVLLNAFLWSMVKLYHDRPDGLASITGKDYRRQFWPMLKRMAIATLPILLILVPALALSTVLLMFVPFAFFIYMLVALPILLIAPIYALEQSTVFNAVGRAFKLGFRQFGTLMLMAITLIILVYVLQGVVMLPWALLIALKSMLLGTSNGSPAFLAVLGNSLFNIFSVLLCYVTYISIAVVLISGAYLYGAAVQQDEDVSIISDIDNFENL